METLKYIVGIPCSWFRARSLFLQIGIVWYIASLLGLLVTGSAWAAYSGVACVVVYTGASIIASVRRIARSYKAQKEK